MILPVILLAFANDREDGARFLSELQDEQLVLDDLLSAHFNVEQKPVATLERIQQAFNTYGQRVRVFHFAGHANADQIELARGKDGHKGGYVEGVAQYIGLQKGVELVFLNGCATAGQVTGFKDAGIPAVIATTAPISDKVAKEFSEIFYTAFVLNQQRKPLKQAFDEAKAQLRGRYPSFDQLYSRKLDIPEAADFDPAEFPYQLYLRTERAGEMCYADLLLQEVGEEKNVPPQAYLLCDRDESTEGFKEVVKDYLREPIRKPVASLVYGEETELPLLLCKRFYEFTVSQTFKSLDRVLEASRFDRFELELPRIKDFRKPHKAFDRLKESFKMKLEMDRVPYHEIRNLDAAQIVSHLSGHYKVIIFQHNLYTAEWDPTHSPAFYKTYLEEFWNVSLPPDAPEILLLFSVQYPPKKGLFSRFKNKDKKLVDSFEQAGAEVLDQLNPVARVDVRRWNDQYAADDPGMTARLFSKKQTLPMEILLPDLIAAVERRRR